MSPKSKKSFEEYVFDELYDLHQPLPLSAKEKDWKMATDEVFQSFHEWLNSQTMSVHDITVSKSLTDFPAFTKVSKPLRYAASTNTDPRQQMHWEYRFRHMRFDIRESKSTESLVLSIHSSLILDEEFCLILVCVGKLNPKSIQWCESTVDDVPQKEARVISLKGRLSKRGTAHFDLAKIQKPDILGSTDLQFGFTEISIKE